MVLLGSCTKEKTEPIVGNENNSGNSLITNPVELLKKGDYELYCNVQTSRDYVNFVGGVMRQDCIDNYKVSPMCCMTGSLCYIIVEADGPEDERNSNDMRLIYQNSSTRKIERFKGFGDKLVINNGQVLDGDFIISEQY